MDNQQKFPAIRFILNLPSGQTLSLDIPEIGEAQIAHIGDIAHFSFCGKTATTGEIEPEHKHHVKQWFTEVYEIIDRTYNLLGGIPLKEQEL
jgi:hypothetical protein